MSVGRHAAYNIGGAIAPVFLMLLTVPLYFAVIGEARYGVLAIIWLVTGSLGFFDFGLGRATAYAFSSKRDISEEERGLILWTAIIVNLGFGILGGLAMWAIAGPLFTSVFNVPADLLAELLPVLPLVALAVPMLTLEGVFVGALTGCEKFLTLNIRTIAGAIVSQLLPLALVSLIAPTLSVAVAATIAARAINLLIFVFVAFRSVPASFRPRIGGAPMIRELMSYGGWISLSGFLNPLVAALDRFLIATFLNPVAITMYTVPYQLVTRGGLFSRSLANALFPKLAKLDEEQVRRLTRKAMRANAALMLVLCSSGIIIMRPFLTLWISAEFSQSASQVGEQLVITVWLTAISVILLNFLEAQGRPRETVRILVLQTIPFVILGVIGVNYFGILGVALARNARSLLNLVLLAQAARFVRETLRLAMLPGALLALLLVVLNLEMLEYSVRLALALVVWAAGLVVADRTFPEGRALIVAALRSRFG